MMPVIFQRSEQNPSRKQSHGQSAQPMREVGGDSPRKIGRPPPSEGQRKIRDRQTGARVAHERAQENL
jgi:hypothetical protein